MASKITLTAFIFLLTIGHLSMAEPIVQTQTFSGNTGSSANLTFDKFNADGILTSIEITLNLQITGGSLIIDNDSDDPIAGIFEFGTAAALGSTDVSLAGGPTAAKAVNYLSVNLEANYNDGENDFSPEPPDGALYNGGDVSDEISGFISNLAQYEGQGSYNITVQTFLHTQHHFTGKIEFLANPLPSVSGYVEVVYAYDPIPEPATILLLYTGIFAIIKKTSRQTT